MQLYALDPTQDTRWESLVASHRSASVFHRRGWLEALARTYGYRPFALTVTPPGEPLAGGVVFCEVRSWITGSRLVSLPFADHCEPLVDAAAFSSLAEWMVAKQSREDWKYIELRPLSSRWAAGCPSSVNQSFWFHTLDLTPPEAQLFNNLHRNSIQRRIQRAEREPLSYERGCSDRLLDEFYLLLMKTRRRHCLLPQPQTWFRNLIALMSPGVELRVARQHGVPIAAIFTLSHRRTVVYKYGCSDERFHALGAMPFLFWKLIVESKAQGAETLDFGRTDEANEGLIRFKGQFGTVRRRIVYSRFPCGVGEEAASALQLPAVRSLFSHLPDSISSRAGGLLYRHFG
jgi:CelD/BcsL family acetyltransferase involved in cellulose biosynthesis